MDEVPPSKIELRIDTAKQVKLLLSYSLVLKLKKGKNCSSSAEIPKLKIQ